MQKYLNVQDWLETNAKLLYAPGITTDLYAIAQNADGESHAAKKKSQQQALEAGYPLWEIGGPDKDAVRAAYRTMFDQVMQNSSDLPERIEHYLNLPAKLRDTPPREVACHTVQEASLPTSSSGSQCALNQEKRKAKPAGIPDGMKTWLPALSYDDQGNLNIHVPKATMDYVVWPDSGKKLLGNLSFLSEGKNRNEDFTHFLQDAFQKYYPQTEVTFSSRQNPETKAVEPSWNISIRIPGENNAAGSKAERVGPVRSNAADIANDWLEKTKDTYAKEPSGKEDFASAAANVKAANSEVAKRIAITTLGNFDYAKDIRVEGISPQNIELSFNTEIAEELVTRARAQAKQRH